MHLPVTFEGKHVNATRFIAKVCHMKCVERSIKNVIEDAKNERVYDSAVEMPHRTKFEGVSLEQFQDDIIDICKLMYVVKNAYDRIGF